MRKTGKERNLSARDMLLDRMRANIRADHAAPSADDEEEAEEATSTSSTGTQQQPSLEPGLQLAALADVRRDATEESDLYEGDTVPFCWSEARGAMRERLQQFRWDSNQRMDAEPKIWINRDRLEAWCMVLPPLNDGAPISWDRIKFALEANDIKAGIDEQAMARLSSPNGYLHLMCIAKGKNAERGEDGSIVDLVSIPEGEIYEEDEKGRINFAEKKWIVNVVADQRLCEIIPPTEGVDGYDVFGHVLAGKDGRPVQRVNGPNTAFSTDGKYLLSTTEGQVIRNGNRFQVTQVLTINGNIDYSTGNVRANGSVVIYGNIMPSFHVQAKHDIIVHGTVEGATVVAGRDLTILGGVMASREGFVHAGNDLRCKFMENARAYCGGDAYFENLILCEVSAEGSIFVTSGRGSVVGGSLVAMGDIHIGTLGNRTYRASQIRIQGTKDFMDRKSRCTSELEEARESWKTADENVMRLEAYRDNPQVSEILSHQESLLNLAEIKITNLKMRLDEFVIKERDMETRRIYIKRAFPNGNLGICGSSLVVHEELRYAVFALKKGQMKMVADRGR